MLLEFKGFVNKVKVYKCTNKDYSMSEKSSSSNSVPLGIGLAALIGIFSLGPIDFVRTSYNAVVGDVPLIRSAAVDYTRDSNKRRNPNFSSEEVESRLATKLNYNLKGEDKINPQKVRMMEIWDATEDYAKSGYDRWVWPTLID
jgi:hypothetical protein